MGRRRSKLASALLWAAFFSQNLVFLVHVSAVGFEDEKNFFPYPIVSPPTVSYSSPPAGGHSTPTPSDHCGGHRSPTPPHNGGGYYHSPPSSTPPIGSTPPATTTSSPSFPFPCTYWKNHPTMIWGMGWGGALGSSLGMPAGPTMPGGFGGQMSLIQALSNTRTDGYGELYREGTAALLNSMADHTKFPYTTEHVRDSFVAALSSNKAAAAQAQLFKLANEGRIKPRA